ncbi:hypothetical protein K7432_018622 [Basidiobolus ranarum]|uniref:Uncharacterized protein n=1 Tax=Basidiobolus ranarum TaxID=34480 RepID=A0ABR2WBX4_9FUNG
MSLYHLASKFWWDLFVQYAFWSSVWCLLLPTFTDGSFVYSHIGGSPVLTFPDDNSLTRGATNLTQSPLRSYDIVAIEMPMVYNKYGDIDLNGVMFTQRRNRNYLKKMRSSILNEVKDGYKKKKVILEMDPLVRPTKFEIDELAYILIFLGKPLKTMAHQWEETRTPP